MRRLGILVCAGVLAGCASSLPERQAELTTWIGRPETELVAAFGAPMRSYDAGGMKFLTYEDRDTEVYASGGPYYFGPGPAGPGGFPTDTVTYVCDTTFTVAGGVVKAFSLRGSGCD